MASSTRFFDCLDTVRPFGAKNLAAVTEGQLKLHLLAGARIRLSQTQAFDSAYVLDYAQDSAFLDLIRHGRIEILLQPAFRNLREVFAGKAAKPDFILSASWLTAKAGGIDVEALNAARKGLGPALQEAARTRTLPEAAADLFSAAQWNNLLELDAALEESKGRLPGRVLPAPVIAPASEGFRSSLAALAAAPAKTEAAARLQMALMDLLEKVPGDDRSPYTRHVDASTPPGHRAELHSVLNMVYNRVIARSLQAPAELTTASRVAKQVVEQHHTDASITLGEPSAARLHTLPWSTLLSLCKLADDPGIPQQAKVAALRAQAVLGAREVVSAGGIRRLELQLLPLTAVPVEMAITHGITFALEHHLPGSSDLFKELIATVLLERAVRPGERALDWLKEHHVRGATREILAQMKHWPPGPSPDGEDRAH